MQVPNTNDPVFTFRAKQSSKLNELFYFFSMWILTGVTCFVCLTEQATYCSTWFRHIQTLCATGCIRYLSCLPVVTQTSNRFVVYSGEACILIVHMLSRFSQVHETLLLAIFVLMVVSLYQIPPFLEHMHEINASLKDQLGLMLNFSKECFQNHLSGKYITVVKLTSDHSLNVLAMSPSMCAYLNARNED